MFHIYCFLCMGHSCTLQACIDLSFLRTVRNGQYYYIGLILGYRLPICFYRLFLLRKKISLFFAKTFILQMRGKKVFTLATFLTTYFLLKCVVAKTLRLARSTQGKPRPRVQSYSAGKKFRKIFILMNFS